MFIGNSLIREMDVCRDIITNFGKTLDRGGEMRIIQLRGFGREGFAQKGKPIKTKYRWPKRRRNLKNLLDKIR
jgi:hypothetical protein